MLTLGLTALGGYLLGSIPFGVVITRAAGAGDVRNIGSGNIGATNVLRTGRKDLALATLLLDAGKGAAALLIARHLFNSDLAGALAGGAAFLGHLFPIWLKFRGGKGVATNAGVSFGLAWPIGLAYAAVWVGMLAISRVSSLSGMSAAVAAPVTAIILEEWMYVPALIVLAVIVLFLHRENIARLRAGSEPRIGRK